MTEPTGAVALPEIQQIVTDLNALLQRAVDHDQRVFCMVLQLAMESLADNLDAVQEWGSDAE